VAKIQQMIEGLTILNKYYDNPNLDYVVFYKGFIYTYKTDKAVSNDDLEKLIELGFYQNHIHYIASFSASDYSDKEYWFLDQ
jgi:hypothetical protein